MRRFLLTVATAASALAVTSCSDAFGVGSNVAGRYELQTINGVFLPVTLEGVTFLYGELQLDSDGTFVDFYQYQVPGSPVEPDQLTGTWERIGNSIRFDADNGDVYEMDIASNNRLIQRTGATLIYERF
jgi:hypothetical protein